MRLSGGACCTGSACTGTLLCADGFCGCASGSDCPSGGTCTSGRCLVTIASSQSAPYLLSVNATNVSWANWTTYANTSQLTIPGSIVTAPVDGGAAATLFSGDIHQGWTGFACDSDDVYWAAPAGLARTSVHAGPTQVLAAAYCDAIALEGTSAYCGGAGVLRVPIAGGPPVTLASLAQQAPTGIVAIAGIVYWNGGTTVESVPVSGGTVATITTGAANGDLAANRSAIYWLTTTGLGASPLSGGPATTVAIPMGPIEHMTVDDASVYWTDSMDGTVMKAPLAGGTPTTLFAGDLPEAIAVDNTSLYWTSPSGGTVMRLTPK